MNDKQFERFLFVIAIVFVLWFFLHKKKATPIPDNEQMPVPWNDPELATFAANPDAFMPQTINGSVNINVSGYNGLNQNYMPLFGFVGMAQGQAWM